MLVGSPGRCSPPAVTNGLLATVPDDLDATFAIEDVQDDPRTADISVQLDPADFVDDPAWVQITAWQGDGLVVDALERTGEGEYRTTEPMPLDGNWKTLLRVHDGRVLTAIPIYLPADEAHRRAEEIPAEDGMTRSAIPEIEILQRELKESGGGLWAVANLVVLACTLALIAAISWGVGRYSRRASSREPYPDTAADPPRGRCRAFDERARQPLTAAPPRPPGDSPCPCVLPGSRLPSRASAWPRCSPAAPAPTRRPRPARRRRAARRRPPRRHVVRRPRRDPGRRRAAHRGHGDRRPGQRRHRPGAGAGRRARHPRRHQRRRRRGCTCTATTWAPTSRPGTPAEVTSTPRSRGCSRWSCTTRARVLLSLQVGVSVLAHGVGSRTDLPIPIGFALYGAGAAILASFAVLLLFWRTPAARRAGLGTPAARRACSGSLDGARAAPRAPGGGAGGRRPRRRRRAVPVRRTPTGTSRLGPLRHLLGGAGAAQPAARPGLRGWPTRCGCCTAACGVLAPAAPGAGRLPALGLWPAAGSLLVFVWLELVYPGRSEPATVAVFLLGYAVVHLGLALWFGEEWFAHGDGFEAYSTLIARLSPWGRRDDGRLVLRNPLANALATPSQPGLAALVVVLLGSTAFDGLSRTVFWQTGPGAANDTLSGTLGLLVMIALVGGPVRARHPAVGPAGRAGPGVQPRRYAAHRHPDRARLHGGALLQPAGPRRPDDVDPGQQPVRRRPASTCSAPTATGSTSPRSAPTRSRWSRWAPSSWATSLGVTLAHERALLSARRARASDQLPLVIVMVCSPSAGWACSSASEPPRTALPEG